MNILRRIGEINLLNFFNTIFLHLRPLFFNESKGRLQVGSKMSKFKQKKVFKNNYG